MSEKGWVLLAMWLMWGLGTFGLAIKNASEASMFGIIAGIVAAVVTVKLLKK